MTIFELILGLGMIGVLVVGVICFFALVIMSKEFEH